MIDFRTKINLYKERILNEREDENFMAELEAFVISEILENLADKVRDVGYAFSIFNELADLKQERIDEILESCFYINLWNEYGDEKDLFWNELNERAKKLYAEAVYLYTSGATPEEQVHYRNKHGL